MDEDTKIHSSEEIGVMLDKLGSSISFGTDLDQTMVTVRCLKKNLQATLDILEERLLEPRFKEDVFDRIKNQTIEGIKNARTRAVNVANIANAKINYGSDCLLGIPSNGTEATVKAIQLADIENYSKNCMSRQDMRIVVVGDITDADTKEIMNRLKKLPNQAVALPKLVPAKSGADANTIYIVNIPKAAQTEFRIGYVTDLKYDATGEYYRVGLMNYTFGGAFNSRVNLNLREDKGWTYGARSGFSGNDYTGSFGFSSGIKSPVTDSALMEVVKEAKSIMRQVLPKMN